MQLQSRTESITRIFFLFKKSQQKQMVQQIYTSEHLYSVKRKIQNVIQQQILKYSTKLCNYTSGSKIQTLLYNTQYNTHYILMCSILCRPKTVFIKHYKLTLNFFNRIKMPLNQIKQGTQTFFHKAPL